MIKMPGHSLMLGKVCPSSITYVTYINHKIIGINAFLCSFTQMTLP